MLAQLIPKKIQPVVEATSYKRQASSSKQCLTMVQGSCRMYIERYNMTKQWYEERGQELSNDLRRVADAMEEILRLVKVDQERSQKYMEERKDD